MNVIIFLILKIGLLLDIKYIFYKQFKDMSYIYYVYGYSDPPIDRIDNEAGPGQPTTKNEDSQRRRWTRTANDEDERGQPTTKNEDSQRPRMKTANDEDEAEAERGR